MLCHETERIKVENIEKVPITFIFGERDIMSDFENQKEFLYQVAAPKNVQWVSNYDHFSFTGHEKDDELQNKILAAFAGDTSSHLRWKRFL